MPEVWIPTMMQRVTGGQQRVRVEGATIRQVVNNLEKEYPGMKAQLCDGEEITPTLVVVVDGEVSNLGMLEHVREDSEVHFLPAIAGGSA